MELKVKTFECVDDAPNYSEEFAAAQLHSAIIVKRGTEEGNPTVDLVFGLIDEEGQIGRYCVAMTTGKILEALGAVCKGARMSS